MIRLVEYSPWDLKYKKVMWKKIGLITLMGEHISVSIGS